MSKILTDSAQIDSFGSELSQNVDLTHESSTTLTVSHLAEFLPQSEVTADPSGASNHGAVPSLYANHSSGQASQLIFSKYS